MWRRVVLTTLGRTPALCCSTRRRVRPRVFQSIMNYTSSSSMPSGDDFVSKHYQLENPAQIVEYLDRKKLSYSSSGTHYKIRECPFCHDTKGQSSNMFKLYVDKTSGLYFCHRCGAAGNWMRFKQQISGTDGTAASYRIEPSISSNDKSHHPSKVVQPLESVKAQGLQANLKSEAYTHVLSYLNKTRGLSSEVLDKYGVGCLTMGIPGSSSSSNEQPNSSDWITFPWMARSQDMEAMGSEMQSASKNNADDANAFSVIRIKARCLSDKSKQLCLPKGGPWGLFGYNTIPTVATAVVITEGEYDAMAVYQATGMPAISLPNGCRSLPPSVLPLLERFETIYLWMDNDIPGQEGVASFSQKLGMKRCLVVRPSTDEEDYKDANDALLKGLDLKKIIASASTLPHSQITSFDELRHEVFQEFLNPVEAAGVQSLTFPGLNKLLKGHRLGEVTVLTGPTGCGKTTFLSQLSLDLCASGVNTLWGSFEIKNTRLLKKMLMQHSGLNLNDATLEVLDKVAEDFRELPLYFLRFFGSTDVDQVLDAMEHAAYVYDVKHFVLDNLQFMMSGQGRNTFDKFERQDVALDKFRKFASNNNVHLTLVIHPRKEQEDVELTLASVFGTAKATQEADNVLILQRSREGDESSLKLDLRKNRFDGTLGSIPLSFNRSSSRMFEQNEDDDSDVASLSSPVAVQHHHPAEAMMQQEPEEEELSQVDDDSTAATNIELELVDIDQIKKEEIDMSLPPQSEPFAQFTNIVHS